MNVEKSSTAFFSTSIDSPETTVVISGSSICCSSCVCAKTFINKTLLTAKIIFFNLSSFTPI